MSVPYDELDPGIREVVRLFNDNGFPTSDSGDGISKVGTALEDCMMGPLMPNVTIYVKPRDLIARADDILHLLTANGINVGPDEATVTELAGPQPEGTEYGDGVLVEASYLPAGEASFILVTGLDDALLLKKRG